MWGYIALKNPETWFLWFIIYSVIGWIYESILCSVGSRRLINRGFLNGPCCPIYGSGACLVVLTLGKIKNPLLLFFAGAVLTCTLEYFTSYFMEKLFHARWWDYSKRRFNIRGRVCLIGAVVFGAFSVVLILFLHPVIIKFTDSLSAALRHTLCASLLIFFIIDCVVTIAGFSGLSVKLEEISEYFERQKAETSGHLHSRDAQGTVKSQGLLLKKKLNWQQRRMLASFPSLRMKTSHYNETLNILRLIKKK